MEKSDHDLDSIRNHLARQSDSSVPAAAVEAKMDSSNESEMKQSHPVIDSQDRREEELPSQPHTPTPPQKLPVNRNQETEVESNDGTPSKQRRCRCKTSRCLKMYCDCFASGSYCNGCNCLKCHNTLENETERQEAIKATLERNPGAFKPKIAGSHHGLNDLQLGDGHQNRNLWFIMHLKVVSLLQLLKKESVKRLF
ncbi:hypothetical protein N665_0326s0035 [Sinapis alba]|nr:hypothetical protein N665_0326s0035 [Sinapis alba]